MERQGIFSDRSAWPVVVIRFPARPWTDQDVDDFIADLQHTYAEERPHGQIVDARIRHLMNAGQRQKLVDFVLGAQPQVERLLVSMAVIIDSAMVRGALTAVTWIVKPYWDLKVVATPEEGLEHVASVLSEKGLKLNALQRLLIRSSLDNTEERTTRRE